MNHLKKGPVQSILLALEALLIIIALHLGSSAQMVMSCYWVIILVYHVFEWIDGVEEYGRDEDKEDGDGKM